MPYVRQKSVFTHVDFMFATVKPDSSPSSVLCPVHCPWLMLWWVRLWLLQYYKETCNEAEPTVPLCLVVGELDSFQSSLLSCLCRYGLCLITHESFVFLTFTFSFQEQGLILKKYCLRFSFLFQMILIIFNWRRKESALLWYFLIIFPFHKQFFQRALFKYDNV